MSTSDPHSHLSQGAGALQCWGQSCCACAHGQDISRPKSTQEVKYIYLPFAFHPRSLPACKHTFTSLWDVSDVVTTACTSWLTCPSSSHNKRRFLCTRIQEVSCREHCDLQCNAPSGVFSTAENKQTQLLLSSSYRQVQVGSSLLHPHGNALLTINYSWATLLGRSHCFLKVTSSCRSAIVSQYKAPCGDKS